MSALIDINGVEQMMSTYGITAQQVVAACARAMNTAAQKGNTHMKRLIADDLKMKPSDVAAKMFVVRASYRMLRATLATRRLDRIPLMYFGGKGTSPSRGRGEPASAAVRGGGRRSYPGSFVASVRYYRNQDGEKQYGLHQGIFIRGPKKEARKSAGAWSRNLPISQLYGPSLGRVFAKWREPVVGLMQKWYDEELQRQLALIKPTAASGGAGSGFGSDFSGGGVL